MEPALRNYSRCITLLCRFGYRIRLPAEDKEIIEKMLKDNDVVSNDCHFYMKFWLGERHVDHIMINKKILIVFMIMTVHLHFISYTNKFADWGVPRSVPTQKKKTKAENCWHYQSYPICPSYNQLECKIYICNKVFHFIFFPRLDKTANNN